MGKRFAASVHEEVVTLNKELAKFCVEWAQIKEGSLRHKKLNVEIGNKHKEIDALELVKDFALICGGLTVHLKALYVENCGFDKGFVCNDEMQAEVLKYISDNHINVINKDSFTWL